jgi:hypothetical protein
MRKLIVVTALSLSTALTSVSLAGVPQRDNYPIGEPQSCKAHALDFVRNYAYGGPGPAYGQAHAGAAQANGGFDFYASEYLNDYCDTGNNYPE